MFCPTVWTGAPTVAKLTYRSPSFVPPAVHLFYPTLQTSLFPLYLGTVILGRHFWGVHPTGTLPISCVSGLASADIEFGLYLDSLPSPTTSPSAEIALKKLLQPSPCLVCGFSWKKKKKEWRYLLFTRSFKYWYIISSNPQGTALVFILLSPFYRWGFWTSEKL